MLKVPPQRIDAEQAILAAMLINPGRRGFVKSSLETSDFYSEKHGILFSVITETDGDTLVILDHLQQKGLLEKAGGRDYLFDLVDAVSTSAGVRHHIGLVKEASRKRELIFLSQNLIDKANGLTSEELHEYLRQGLNRLDLRDRFGQRRGVDIGNVYTAEKMLKEYAGYIETLKENRFITGIHEIDRRIRGVAGGEVLFIIARAGSFKTALLQNLLKNYIQHSAWAAVFFSLEMPIASLTERFQEIIQGARGRDIEEHYTSHKDGVLEFRKALEQSFSHQLERLFVVPTKVSVPEVAQYVRLVEREFKAKVGVIGIDYLGLMDGQGQGEYEILSKLARDIKGLAKMLNLPVVVLSQTSRRGGSGDVEIELDMARGSGAIEEAADFVLGLFQVEGHRPAIDFDEPAFDVVCKILKNRKGSKNSRWKLDLDPTTFRIGREAEPWQPPKRKRSML